MRAVWWRGVDLNALRWLLLAGLVATGIIAMAVARTCASPHPPARRFRRLLIATPSLESNTSAIPSCAGMSRRRSVTHITVIPWGRSMALASELPIPGLPSTGKGIEFISHGLTYAIERKDGRIIHSETRLDDQARPIARVESEVKYSVGSGHRGLSYLIERDGFLMQSPISWYTQEKRAGYFSRQQDPEQPLRTTD